MLDYRHLQRMTDSTGMLQFSQLSTPDPSSGYTLDDNARALIVTLNMKDSHDLALIYANWLFQAQRIDGSWSNLQVRGNDIRALDSEDSVGRALLACALGSGCAWPDVQGMCLAMFNRNLPRAVHFKSPRAVAYTLTGLCMIDKPMSRDHLQLIRQLSSYLTGLYQQHQKKGWYWFENSHTYCNGILPQALFSVYARTGNKKALKTGHEALSFLCDILFRSGYLNIVGNKGWYKYGEKPPCFDQQPVDAASTAGACLAAYQSIGGQHYLGLARQAHRWYHGANINQLKLYDQKTGGCYDALTEEGVNLNQGAEAILSFLLCEQLMAKHLGKDQPAAIEQSS